MYTLDTCDPRVGVRQHRLLARSSPSGRRRSFPSRACNWEQAVNDRASRDLTEESCELSRTYGVFEFWCRTSAAGFPAARDFTSER
jgi:hypothetical protein